MKNEEKIERLTNALLEFVERVAKNATTEAETQALPAVALVVRDLLY